MIAEIALAGAGFIVLVTVVSLLLAARREQELEAEPPPDAAEGGPPPSLHPVIDLEVCMGSAACVTACPEALLKISGGVTYLDPPGDCVGHGRCQVACPVDAIKLVFGSAERGVDLPVLRAGYETNVDGVFIAGELGGMGLIRNAMSQGLKAVGSIPQALGRPGVRSAEGGGVVDAVIVGAGPAGLAAALQCTEAGLTYALLEQDTLGGSVAHYPRRKIAHTAPIKLPFLGRVLRREMTKEELLEEFERIVQAAAIEVREGHRVTGVTGEAGDFEVTCDTSAGSVSLRSRTVILAVGRRGTPRRLEVPGEEQSHVVYRLIDAEQYRGRRVLCVGGGDSAVEAAVALAGVARCEAHLSYRRSSFSRIKRKNRLRLDEAVAAGRLHLHLETTVESIGADEVVLAGVEGTETLAIDDVIVNVGGVLPTALLDAVGVEVETRYGE
jgi:thioredoxin reductase/NAD-dependent dihydropyrimidine dehydrogenase PreA subunit